MKFGNNGRPVVSTLLKQFVVLRGTIQVESISDDTSGYAFEDASQILRRFSFHFLPRSLR